MPIVIPGGFALATHQISLIGDPEPMAVTYGVEVSSLTQSVVEELHTDAGTEVANFMNNEYSVTSTILMTELIALESTGGSIPGANGGDSLPQNTAILVKKNSGFRGRQNRGRCYVPGLEDANVDSIGNLSPSALSAFQATADAWYAAILGVTGIDSVVILHSTVGLGAPTPVVNFEIDPRVATQRRRLR